MSSIVWAPPARYLLRPGRGEGTARLQGCVGSVGCHHAVGGRFCSLKNLSSVEGDRALRRSGPPATASRTPALAPPAIGVHTGPGPDLAECRPGRLRATSEDTHP